MRKLSRLVLALAVSLGATVAGASPLSLSVVQAEVGTDVVTGMAVLSIMLAPESREAFAGFTRENVGKRTVVSVGGEPVMDPVIREPITAGLVQIAGEWSKEDLERIAASLVRGATLDVELAPEPDRPGDP